MFLAMIFTRRIWIVLTIGLLVSYGITALTVKAGYPRTVMGDATELLLILIAGTVVAGNAIASRGQTRLFWVLMSAGCLLWSANSASWTYFEVILHKGVPDPFFGDVILFLHVVPLMAAVAIRPHIPQQEQKLYSSTLNFLILLVWWMFLYAFLVFPDQYVIFNAQAYSRNFDSLYLLECSLLVVALAVLAARTLGKWRKVYWNLFIALGLYMWSSLAINEAITRGVYATGSFYDIPLVAALCWFILAALIGREAEPTADAEPAAASKWEAMSPRLAMAAILSLPVLGFWAQFINESQPAVHSFRLLATLGAMLVLGLFVFLRQYLLDRELVRLVETSRKSYEDLARLQNQVIQREKLASLGQLVAGAAHEINNPVAAILGYSELLALNRDLAPAQVSMAQKIGQQARRTRDLVTGLLSFAQQASGEKTLVDLGSLLDRCLKMKILQLESAGIHVDSNIMNNLPPVHGNFNQLMQCCLEIIDNSLDAMEDVPGGVLSVIARRERNEVVLEFDDTGVGIREPQRVFDPFYTTKPIGKGTGLGLSATYGVVQDHQGQISCSNRRYGGASFIMRFPVADPTVMAPKALAHQNAASAS